MKILHCADIHLDSPLSGVKDGGARRNEILLSFCDMVEYANSNEISAVLICGDLFDNDNCSQATFLSVADILSKYKHIQYFILRGNHGGTKAYDALASLNQKNVKFFPTDAFKTYDLGEVTISGCELEGNDQEKYASLKLPSDKYNVVMLHADLDSDTYGFVDAKALEKAGTKYLALGHRHTLTQKRLGKMKIVYTGVLETRGFDETGETGFVVFDTSTNYTKFVPQARRKVASVTIDVSKKSSSVKLMDAVSKAIADVSSQDYLNIILVGQLKSGVSVSVIEDSLKGKYFALRIQNDTTIPLDLDKVLEELSLKSEFVRLAMEIEDERQRNDVIKLGLAALSNEEVAL